MNFLHRVAALQERANQMAQACHEEQLKAAPCCDLLIERLLDEGEAVIRYYPHGRIDPPEERRDTLNAALAWIDENKIPTHCNLVYCPLWAHLNYQHSELYTPEQKRRFMDEDTAKYPEVAELYRRPDKDAIISTISELPQFIDFELLIL